MGRPRYEQPFTQADSTTSQESSKLFLPPSQENQNVRCGKSCVATYKPIAPITAKVIRRGQQKGSRGLEGDVSKPQIPYRDDWFVSNNEISSCGSATWNTPRTTSINTPTNRRLKQVESGNKQEFGEPIPERESILQGAEGNSRQLLRQDITEKEESTNGEYDIDIAKYFKLLSPDVNETIFEEHEWVLVRTSCLDNTL